MAGVWHSLCRVNQWLGAAAMNQLTKNLCCEWGPEGIRVNAVSPWYITTPLAQQVLQNEEYKAEVLSRTPLRRVGSPSEVSGMGARLPGIAMGTAGLTLTCMIARHLCSQIQSSGVRTSFHVHQLLGCSIDWTGPNSAAGWVYRSVL